MMKKTILFGICIACLGAKVPEWFLKPTPLESGFYGIGSGKDNKSAKQDAIADLVGTIQLNIQTSFNTQTKRVGDTLSSSATQDIKLNTQMFKLINIKVAQSECDDGVCYTRVEIKKDDLLTQLRGEILLGLEKMKDLASPFDYRYKKDILYPEILSKFSLYSALGGKESVIPKNAGDQPTLAVIFEYDGNFKKTFKSILEKTIKDDISKYAKISANSEWKIIIGVYKEEKTVTLDISAKNKNEEIHNASVCDTQKPNISDSFFTKRLGVQAYKKIKQWSKYSSDF